MALVVNVLGPFEVRGSSGPVVLPTRKSQALLAFLALKAGQVHPREKLAALLWGERPDEQARRSLRQALTFIRRAVSDSAGGPLASDRAGVSLDGAALDIDTTRFERLVADGTPESLARAAVLYRGDLLDGIRVDEPAFDEWLSAERERLRELAIEGLARLLAHQIRADGVPDPAIHTALKLAALEPLEEAVHRALMRLYARAGRRGAALRQYETCVRVLQRELARAPEPQTRQLFQDIVQGPASAEGPAQPGHDGPVWVLPGLAREAELIGRDAELTRAQDALGKAWSGRGRVLLVRGEAGIGKTRLIAELASEAARRRGRVLFARCYETERVLPFRPWVEALRSAYVDSDRDLVASLSAAHRASLARLFPALGAPAPAMPASAGDPAALFEALATLLERAVEREPAMLVIEDLHWADDPTLRLLAFVGRRLARHRLLLASSVRDEEILEVPLLPRALQELAGDGLLDEIALSPLTRADTARLASALGGTAAAEDAVARQVWALSEGNPFVIVETIRAIGQGAGTAPIAEAAMADAVRRSIASRLERVPETAGHLVGVAAVIGHAFSFRLLHQASALGERAAAAGLEELVRRRVLNAIGSRFDFAHDRIRQVALARLLPATRTITHRMVAEALERLYVGRLEDVHDRLAHHYAEAGNADRAVTYLARCAETARNRSALDAAVAFLDRAVEVAGALPAGEAGPRLAELITRKAYVLSLGGRFADSRALLLAHRELVDRLDRPELAGPFHVRLGMVQSYLGAHAEALDAGARALEAGTRVGDVLTVGLAHHVLASVAYWTASPGEGLGHARHAVDALADTGATEWLGFAYWVLAAHQHMLGEFSRALETLGRVLALGRTQSNARMQGFALFGASWAHASRGDVEAAIAAGQGAIEVARDPFTRAAAQGLTGFAYVEAGQPDVARPLLEASLGRFRAMGNRNNESRFLVFLAKCELLAGDPARATALAGEALEIACATRSRWYEALALRTLGRAAQAGRSVSEAVSRLTAARDLFAEIGGRYEVARTELHLAEALRARGDATGARAAEAARDAFQALDVPVWLARAEAALRTGPVSGDG